MKRVAIISGLALLVFVSCNDATTDSVEKADSTNEAKQDQEPKALQTDEATTDFLVKAADGGLTEVEAGKLAEQKATHAGVKRFAAMMVNDHTGANAEVKTLAAARNVTLPTALSEDHKDKVAKASEKSGKDFDKAYMEMMVDDHKNTIDLFEKAANNSKDEQVKTFINNTLPKLRMHLDSAEAIRKAVKN